MPKIPERKLRMIGIVGSRRRDDEADFHACLAAFDEVYVQGDCIVSGGCEEGGDRFAEIIAEQYGIAPMIHYPNEDDLDQGLLARNRRAAYAKIDYARNTLIAQDCDILIAVVAPDRTGGTEDTINKARRLHKKIILVN